MGTPLKQNRSLKENANSRHDKKQHLDIKWQRTKYKVKTITTIFKVSFCRGDFSSFSYLWLPTTCILPPLQGNHELSWVRNVGKGMGIMIMIMFMLMKLTRNWFRLDATVSAALFATNASFTYLLSWVFLHHKFMGVKSQICIMHGLI